MFVRIPGPVLIGKITVRRRFLSGKHIPVKTDRTALVYGVRKHFPRGFRLFRRLSARNEFHAIQSAAFETLDEICPAGLVLFQMGCSSLSPNTRYLVFQPRPTDAIIVISAITFL